MARLPQVSAEGAGVVPEIDALIDEFKGVATR
jgi:hypothetical protein